ncbi:LptF/LptG family permease [Persicobacter psychrovividus]|uniref:YjgP/YjgQ family permease n=1 Tax=Persicobacter psychrovividus TaxID=387638 RepID=A0ABM7VCM8_9BACT|nr:hypothetical protein PEPS_09670 [Persicobacter psychrovividus]
MKKLDKLILQSFIGPFIGTLAVAVFVLLAQFFLRYFDELVGKGLGASTYFELVGYFSIFMIPQALPLAVLLSSLMTFGNLGEHFELTAIKSSGISLLRVLRPIFIFSIILSGFAFYCNDQIVPKANLKAWSLLYDIKRKKPAMEIKPGVFYGDLPGYKIRVKSVSDNGKSMKNMIIYNHSDGQGNKEVILADSGDMYMIHNQRYLVMELYHGNSYTESNPDGVKSGSSGYHDIAPLMRNHFQRSKMVFSMQSFDLERTREDLFSSNRMMKNVNQLGHDIDSLQLDANAFRYEVYNGMKSNSWFKYHLKGQVEVPDFYAEQHLKRQKIIRKMNFMKARGNEIRRLDSLAQNGTDTTGMMELFLEKEAGKKITKPVKESGTYGGAAQSMLAEEGAPFDVDESAEDSINTQPMVAAQAEPEVNLYADYSFEVAEQASLKVDSLLEVKNRNARVYRSALSQSRYVKNTIMSQSNKIENRLKSKYRFQIEWQKKFAMSMACVIMFLIGAPLGAIIKKGGLGFPVLISIVFFIFYFIVSMTGEKWAKEGLVSAFAGIWAADFVLLPFGLFFLRQARVDARLFDTDFYAVVFDRIKMLFKKKTKQDALPEQKGE